MNAFKKIVIASLAFASCFSPVSLGLPALASTTTPVVKAFAQVSAAGNIIIKSDHVTGVSHISLGVYEVAFNIKVNKCAWFATLVYPGNPTSGGGAQTGHDGTSKIFVRLGSGGSGSFDSEFHLAVIC